MSAILKFLCVPLIITTPYSFSRFLSFGRKYQNLISFDFSLMDSNAVLTESSEIVTGEDMDTGDIQNMIFKRISAVNGNIAKYRIDGKILSQELNSYLEEYKEEMKKRKVVFPGFRPGKLPPYVMVDVRRYVVSYGLEMNIGQLCNNNGIILCNPDGGDVEFGEDSVYESIFLPDALGYDFQKQRDAWREGQDFSFVVEFFARDAAPTNLQQTPEDADNKDADNIIDTTLVEDTGDN